jgi:hypothetical protein
MEYQQLLCSNEWKTFEWPKPQNLPKKQHNTIIMVLENFNVNL